MKNTIERPIVTLGDWNKAVADLQEMVPTIREQAGPGAFICPHEVLGMLHGQTAKLSAEADKALYNDDPTEARKRMLKAAYGLIFGAASMDVVYR